jgi:hypothetical protein
LGYWEHPLFREIRDFRDFRDFRVTKRPKGQNKGHDSTRFSGLGSVVQGKPQY